MVQVVISGLLERGLLNDERYAELWIRSCLTRKAPSPLWLLVSLGKKGIGRNSSLAAIKKVLDPETEYALLLKYMEKMDISKEEKPSRLKSLLKYQGFSNEVLELFFNYK